MWRIRWEVLTSLSFLLLLFLSPMLSFNHPSQSRTVIYNNRLYRYVGNGSLGENATDFHPPSEDSTDETFVNTTTVSSIQTNITEQDTEVVSVHQVSSSLREEESPHDLQVLKDAPTSQSQKQLMPLPFNSGVPPVYSPRRLIPQPLPPDLETDLSAEPQLEEEEEREKNHHHDRDDNIFIEVGSAFSNPQEFIKKYVEGVGEENEVSPVHQGSFGRNGGENDIHTEQLMRGLDDGDGPKSFSQRHKKLPPLISPAGCVVEMRTVHITDDGDRIVPPESTRKEMITWYPWCVRVPRCSGCCPSSKFKCVPTSVSVVNITAIKMTHESFSTKFRYQGTKVFQIQQHHACRCECEKQPGDCNQYQVYQPQTCGCVCRDPGREFDCKQRPDKIWVESSCECQCRKIFTNCPGGKIFSNDTCRCEAPPPHVIVNGFPSFRFHSSFHSQFDVEFQKQAAYTQQVGSSGGINPDDPKKVPIEMKDNKKLRDAQENLKTKSKT